MKFFVPYAESDEQAEVIWSGLRERLFDLGLPTTRRRIAAVSLEGHSDVRFEVGEKTRDAGEPVLVILEARGLDLYWVFTRNHGLIRGAPYPVLDETGSAVPFEQSPIERLWGDYLY